jgi:hypothetical protein
MRSSTSSSSTPRWRDVLHLAFALWVLAVLVGFAALFAPEAASSADIVAHQEPPDAGNFYLAHDRGGHIDHHVLYHGIDATARERMRAADVLFLGNSRLMFALQPQPMREFFSTRGLDYYVLGFGHEEQDDFPLEIIRANDLRPSLVVVNADHFFASEQSDWAAQVVDESDFDAWKVQFEGEMAHRVRRALHRIVPHYVDLRRGQREVVLYRSRDDGTWLVANDFGEGVRFEWPEGDRDVPSPAALDAAEAFAREIRARGAQLVLVLVPGPNVSLHRAEAIASHLSVPLVVPDASEVRTIDNSHLSRDSAARVVMSLLERLRPYLP